ncbi:hypothetical protein Y032_0314g2208, partial [Ancylostoma ceylanicum]
ESTALAHESSHVCFWPFAKNGPRGVRGQFVQQLVVRVNENVRVNALVAMTVQELARLWRLAQPHPALCGVIGVHGKVVA